MKISKVVISSEEIKLISPYKLSFTTINSIKCNIIRILLNTGKVGSGECTALPGYGTETFEDIDKIFREIHLVLKGLNYEAAKNVVVKLHKNYPFAASAIGTALDFAFTNIILPEKINLPLIFPISASSDPAPIVQKVHEAYKQGFKTIKVKIGRNFEEDIITLKELLKLDLDLKFRLDANQAYSLEQAHYLITNILTFHSEKIEYFEQPLPKNDWDNLYKLCQLREIAILLDESIYNEKDVKKAASIGVKYIKLKLCKTKGFYDLINMAKKANKLGLKVVLGNGVSTDIGNLIEAIAYHYNKEIFYGAFEGNGFYKLTKCLLKNSPVVREGKFVWKNKGLEVCI